ncbi:MAG: helix-turn-helix domain-containing protein [Proteobacteria bacterium]|nr:helix-turn-helix domain-containing protein [Pseudomonadota bacterium]MCP4915356.1 helix-turn-helix domain-containing protein [Pseudomonadota bacterium]
MSITVTERQRSVLEGWRKNKAGTSAQLYERCSIILLSADGIRNTEQAQQLGIDRQRVRRWRRRWAENEQRLAGAEREGVTDKDLARLLRTLLSDELRPGTPPTFTAEQLTQIIAVACELPEESGRPVTHWTPRELADEVIKRGIVSTISPRHVDRLLKGGISVHTRPSTG